MIRHIVSWNFKESLTDSEKVENGKKMKGELEALKEVISEVSSIKVFTDSLATSDREITLDSLFESEEALAAYQIHPAHVKVGKWLGTIVENRLCIDFEEK